MPIKRFKKISIILVSGLLAILLLVLLADFRIARFSKYFHTYDLSEVDHFDVGVVLGTSKWVRTGQKNLYFSYRIQAAVQLYRAGKIKKILVSGDNGTKYYNEPKDMRDALMDEGIPEDDIILDYAGFRTLDSVLRAQKVFGLNRFLIISQQFHNERAIFLARKNDIDAFGFNAKDVDTFRGIKTKFREYLARVKVFYDLWFGVKPKMIPRNLTSNYLQLLQPFCQIAALRSTFY